MSRRQRISREEQPRPQFGILLFAVSLVAIAGYVGYELYPRFELPPVESAGLLVLAAAAGVASFFSPCAFPLLVTLLAKESQAHQRMPSSPLRSAVGFALALSVGAAAFLGLAGVAISFGAGALFSEVTFTSTAGRVIRATAGALLILMGLVQIGFVRNPFGLVHKIALPLQRTQARQRRQHPQLGFAIFGFAYLLAGFG